MLLDHALTELLLAKDYTSYSARRREEVLGEFIQWARQQDITTVEAVTRSAARRYVADLRERPNKRYGGKLSSETQHSRASIVHMFLRFCAREGWLDERVVAYFDMPRRAYKVVQVFTQDHFARLMRATDECALPPLRTRDKSILALLLDTGLRANELCTLTFDAVSISPQESFIRIEGKGRRQREVGMGKQATLALHRYRSRGRPESECPQVFLDRHGRPLTPNALDRLLHRLRDVAGREHFAGIRVSPHTLRHSYCRPLHAAGRRRV